MKIHNVTQGEEDWFKVRLGKPTASSFDKIITPTGKPSTQADKYMNWLLAELMVGKPLETFKNEWMERGNELEPAAADFYSFTKEVELEKVGFITDDAEAFGCSPDRLIGEDGLLEIKCPAPHTHVGYLLNPIVDGEYMPQLQGQLLITGRKWVDIISYHPELSPVIIRVERNETFIRELGILLGGFMNAMNDKKEILRKKGFLAL